MNHLQTHLHLHLLMAGFWGSVGVAVGTTGVSDKQQLKLVVAFAMILHKVPATFGMVTFLLAAKWPRSRIKGALLIFAASAPLTALLTYWLLVRSSSCLDSTSHHRSAACCEFLLCSQQPARSKNWC